MAFKDENVTIVPVRACSANNPDMAVYSFVCIPEQVRGKFLPKIATELGCKPKEHFSRLTKGETVILEDGTEILPSMVSEKAAPACASELVFLPGLEYLESFITENENFHQLLQ